MVIVELCFGNFFIEFVIPMRKKKIECVYLTVMNGLPEDRSEVGPGSDRSGPVQDRLQTGPVLGPRFGKFSVFGPAGPVRSWTDEHPYILEYFASWFE